MHRVPKETELQNSILKTVNLTEIVKTKNDTSMTDLHQVTDFVRPKNTTKQVNSLYDQENQLPDIFAD